MTDCEDDSDVKPEGSIADVREDLASVAESFQAEYDTNVADRADGDPVEAPGGEHEAGEPETQDPFNPQPVLLLTHAGGAEQRPLPRRSEAEGPRVPPIRSDSVTIDTDVVEPGGDYTIEVSVRNVGGKAARKVDVELFVEHLQPDVRIDTRTGGVELQPQQGLDEEHSGYRVSGVTTMAPDSKLTVFAHMEDEGPPFDKVLDFDADTSVAEDRTFTGYLRGKPEKFMNGEPVPEDRSEFTVEVWETTLTDPDVIGRLPSAPGFFQTPEYWGGVRLGGAAGRYVDSPGVDERNQYLASSRDVEGVKRIEKKPTSIQGSGAQTVSFSYAPTADDLPTPRENIDEVDADFPGIDEDDGPGIGRTVTVFYARAYSLATGELPEDWNELDHTKSRFMARTEVPREG